MTYNYPPAPKKKSKVLPVLLGILIGLALLCGVLAVTGALTGSPSPTAATDPASTGQAVGEAGATAASKAAIAVKPKGLTAGTWQVGPEVAPGTYVTTADGHCYWARLKAFDGELSSIITNANLDPGQRGRLTVKASDKGLELTGDCTWVRAK